MRADSIDATDVVGVGSGAAGLAAALTAKHSGLDVVILEKAAQWGGSTARSGGGVWIPGNQFLPYRAGDVESARTYLHHIVGDRVDAERIDAYLDHGPEAVAFLAEHSALDLEWVCGYSDYFPEAPGGRSAGRSCEPRPFDARRLGDALETMAPFYTKVPLNVVVKQSDYRWLSTGLRHWRGPLHMLRVGARTMLAKARGQHLVGVGSALVATLMVGVQRAGIPLRLNTALQELTVEDGRVTGVVTNTGTRHCSARSCAGVRGF
ncbi:3-ketosteroid-delta-1-dehydrogenase [Mycobacteroides abscessus subsp. abscessus]|nr:3-ketosteroid-delta-1-dehydrogenase [Mycobacteroides abscessus subsp. abscessus]SHT55412.1 3-ketosteroid-delta-1-dehydrogenase [Mycobacteroides abscessus subsp. abscessus]SHT57999.1 3-ketosteroid-delta-1-dehydrogenase [Mycobacteroides abscessus subsp. abscessus]SHX51697.1 3-ketosteroid-delta-1-dehydrogenase [Mycobacteroides abscessus subsp. abscessus]SIB59438.1 3-ketosteroid-delta-1-dehydrogenase [Mycobacteroides abscessus subsp. abscessus]